MSTEKTRHIKARWIESSMEKYFLVINNKTGTYHLHGRYANTRDLIESVKRGKGIDHLTNFIRQRKPISVTIMG